MSGGEVGSSVRYIVMVVLVASLAFVGAGCGGQDQAGEKSTNSGKQYAAGEPTAPATVGTGFSEKSCFKDASKSGDAGVKISDPGKVPSYQVVDESKMQTGKSLKVVTKAKSREELKAVAEKLRYENRKQDALSIDFYNESKGDRKDAGLALVFNTRKAACSAFQYPVNEQDEIVSKSNGISVVSVQEGV